MFCQECPISTPFRLPGDFSIGNTQPPHYPKKQKLRLKKKQKTKKLLPNKHKTRNQQVELQSSQPQMSRFQCKNTTAKLPYQGRT